MRVAFLLILLACAPAPIARADNVAAPRPKQQSVCVAHPVVPGRAYWCEGQMWQNGRVFEPHKRAEKVGIEDHLPPPPEPARAIFAPEDAP